jgi:hypothetical protein
LADLTDPDDVFTNMQYAYTFKDTLIYGDLLTDDFVFTYRDYELGYDVSWGRTDEMRATHGLFENAERLDLIWNNVVVRAEDSLRATVVRGYTLTITFNVADVSRVDGRANFTLAKNKNGKWAIEKWIDESNF